MCHPAGTGGTCTARRSSSPRSARRSRKTRLPLAVVRARFGPPAAEYHVGDDIIMTYRYNLLTRLRHPAFPGLS